MLNYRLSKYSFTASIIIGLGGLAQAKVNLPAFFSDGMVLQQEKGAKLWGTANPSSEVVVDFAGRTEKVKSDAEGNWLVTFNGLKASKAPQNLVLTNGNDKQVIKDVLVGEVWLASGQSNMEWPISKTNSAAEAKTANDSLLRVYVSGNVAIGEPQKDFKGTWQATKPGNTQRFTAVGYQFGKKLRSELDVPVGIIECAWGGKPVEAFISNEALAKLPESKALMKAKQGQVDVYKKAQVGYAEKVNKFQAALKEWQVAKEGPQPVAPKKPKKGDPNRDPRQHSNIYNGMIAPLVGYGVRGAIWYQGESNANNRGAKASEYEEYQACMVNDWRARWGYDLSFYYVQLANFRKPPVKAGASSPWATVQDEQRQMLKTVKGSGMAVINDIGAANDIHPKNKKDVGERLARWALHNDYGKKDVVVSGPLYAEFGEYESKILISFDYAKGLKSRDGKPLQRFEIAGADGVWHWAEARIVSRTKVLVSSKHVKKPVKVRYAWADNPTGANLVNAEGLPASCFTTETK